MKIADLTTNDKVKNAEAIHQSLVASNVLREWKEKDIVKPDVLNAQNKALLAEMAELGGEISGALASTQKKSDDSLKSMDEKSLKLISDIRAMTTVREFLLKGEENKNISSLEFKLSATDVKFEDVESFEIIATSLNSTSNTNFILQPLNYLGNNIAGYMGYYADYENGSNSSGRTASHNSNNGQIWFPAALTVSRSQNSYYGNGVNARVKLPVKARTNAGGYKSIGTVDYEIHGWTTSCSTYPNNENGRWSNNSSNQGWAEDIHGFRITPSSGAFYNGDVIVRVHLRAKKVGA